MLLCFMSNCNHHISARTCLSPHKLYCAKQTDDWNLCQPPYVNINAAVNQSRNMFDTFLP